MTTTQNEQSNRKNSSLKLELSKPAMPKVEPYKQTAKDIALKPDLFLSGHRACAGCGPATVLRLVTKALRGPTIVTQATGCMEIVCSIYPYTSWGLPWLHTAFENVAANASGIEAAVKALGKKGKIKQEHIDVIAIAGDGGTYDIGLQALSGAIERGHDFLFILYDNEGYMNTGIQRSGGTPMGASTTTTPAGKVLPGKMEKKKPLTEIILAHDIEYVATATPYYWKDMMSKVQKGLEVEGSAFLHIFAPCPRGWRTDPSRSMSYSKLSVETCVFPIWEAVNGKRVLSIPSKMYALAPQKKKPVIDYLEGQGRFRHLFKPENKHVIDQIQQATDNHWQKLLKQCETTIR
ncbi:MAG: thiamine pyrophosphate-dependent enzyme [Candidatus Bathyarchaeota archaeon]|uniref:thiamine pyrophosphate-dependent enzyme n=1 Tax=Candidatus Bathycorpusculum sp. TaxID=2994959 RepID=UPI00281B47B4|nr:thiamine pyrophosphate-dependent enzyme [Candidatus Termiticorpusculum sp.]MCL2256667.1 thiamine pyrophosphate-dependent enzyme [Candidatus Termiticorpusculum sp.]MCL2292794.1 thiamine pyrophosphate-dependent enzyme [Candidatus Termiticorpusculum sp.]